MTIISETVNTHYYGATRIIRAKAVDKGNILQTKKVYFLGIKVYETSTYEQASMMEKIGFLINGVDDRREG